MKVKNFLKSIDAQAIVAYTDNRGVIEYVNDNFCDISGYAREELLGKTHQLINSGIHPKGFFKSMWETILGGNVWIGEICNKAKSGNLYWVKTTISPEFNEKGGLVGFFAIRYDITKQKLLENENTELVKLNESIQEIANIGGWEYHTESNKVVWTNQTYRIHEVPFEIDISLELSLEFFIAEDKERFQASFNNCLEKGEPWDGTYQIITAKSRKLWIRSAGEAIYDKKGTIKKVRAIIQDISEKKEAEIKAENERKVFLHSAKLSTLGEMASTMIHEISNPLTVIKGMVDAAKRKNDVGEIHQLIEKTNAPLERLLKMVSNLRQFSRNEAVTRELKMHNIQELLKNSIEYTSHKFSRSNVELRLLNDQDLFFMCEGTEMEQVFVNILSNAVDAIEDLEERWVEIDFKAKSYEGIKITITDSGGGIPKEVRDNIFDSFFTTKEKEKGTGIGLGVVSNIITDHNAKISVCPECKNTRFIIEFPKEALTSAA